MALLRDYISITSGQIVNRVQANKEKGDQVIDKDRKVIVAKSITEGIIDDENVKTRLGLPDRISFTSHSNICWTIFY